MAVLLENDRSAPMTSVHFVATDGDAHDRAMAPALIGEVEDNAPTVAEIYDLPSIGAEDASWKDDGACKAGDPDDFFPESLYITNSVPHRAAVARAKALCAVCPVRDRCLQFALDHRIQEGIWGGLTWSGRQALRYPRPRVNGKLTYVKDES